MIKLIFALFASAIPAYFLWEVASIKVNVRLPKDTRKRLFKLGRRFALVAIIIESAEHAIHLGNISPLGHAYFSALFAAIPEELVKCAAVYRFGRRELDEIGPGIAILLAVGASLGFAALENFFYVMHGGLATWLVRALVSVPMHAVNGFTMGAFLALAWRSHKGTDPLMVVLALAVPMAFHFSFDFLVMLHAKAHALAWPLQVLPAVIAVQIIFALILTNHAVNMPTGLYGQRNPVDPTGRLALQFAGIAFFLALLAAAFQIGIGMPHHLNFVFCIVPPLLFALDLGMMALARSRRYA